MFCHLEESHFYEHSPEADEWATSEYVGESQGEYIKEHLNIWQLSSLEDEHKQDNCRIIQ